MSDHVTIRVQDAATEVRAVCEQWEGQVHLTFVEYTTSSVIPSSETETHCPSLSPEGARALSAVLLHLACEADR